MVFRTIRYLLVATVVLSLGIGPASGAVDLDRVPARVPRIEVLGASSAGVLYRVSATDSDAPDIQTIWMKPAGAAAYVVPRLFETLAGNKIFNKIGASNGGASYQLVGSPTIHECDIYTQQPGAFTSFGWITAEAQRVEVDATGCRTTTQYAHEGQVAAADDQGFIVNLTDQDGIGRLIYHSYADAAHPTTIADGGYNHFVFGIALRGSSVSWAVHSYSPTEKESVLRASTDGSPAKVVATPALSLQGTAVAGGSTGWSACNFEGEYSCQGGSTDADGTKHQLNGTWTVVSDGSRFVFDTHGASAGVDAAAAVDATTPRTRIVAIPLQPPVAKNVVLGASTAVYQDSQRPIDSIYRRSYTRSGSTVTVSSQTLISQTSPGRRVLSRDGRRTAYLDNSGDLWLVTDDGVRTRVFDAVDKVAAVVGDEVTLSGSLLVWHKGLYTGDSCDLAACQPTYGNVSTMLYSVRSGASTPLTGPVDVLPVALWSNYLAYLDATNAIWRRDLSSNALVQVKTAGGAPVNDVAVHDDYVAWSTCTPGSSNYCGTGTVNARNMATRTAPLQVVTPATQHIDLSGGHVLFDSYSGNFPPTGTLKVMRLGTTATGVVSTIAASSRFAVFDETLAWIGPDTVAQIGPNSAFVAPPRFLGNNLGAASFHPASGNWTPEFGISKALPTCNLTIRSGTTVRRVLTCGTSVGSARPVWNGLDSAGHLVPKGTYTFTLTGGDSDGTLRWWTNATHPISGTIQVT